MFFLVDVSVGGRLGDFIVILEVLIYNLFEGSLLGIRFVS
jgi:hypothetical protein